jgi:hypothetical protein
LKSKCLEDNMRKPSPINIERLDVDTLNALLLAVDNNK